MKDFGDLMKQAQQMQASLQDAQAQITQMEVQGESGAGMVKVVMNGRYEVKSVVLDSALLSEDKEVLEDLLAAACNDTVRKVEQAQSEKMQDIGGGLLGGLLMFARRFACSSLHLPEEGSSQRNDVPGISTWPSGPAYSYAFTTPRSSPSSSSVCVVSFLATGSDARAR